jgi:Flp pilus assembly protein TadG
MTTWNPLLARSATLASRLRQERGQALVEFAVVLPVLLLIVMGIIFFGRYESYSSQMTQLAEVGARDGAVDFTPASGNLAAYIQSQATGELAGGSQDVQQLSVRVQCWSTATTPAPVASCTVTPATTVHVCTQAVVQFPFLPIKASTIAQKATMLAEQPGLATPTTGPNVAGPNPPSAANC